MQNQALRLRRYAVCALTLLTLTGNRAALAEDIDLFTGLQTNAGTKPNVLLLLDNASTWDASASFTCNTSGVVSANNAGTDVGAEQCALFNAVTSLANSPTLLGNLNLGLMMFGTGTNVGGQFKFPAASPPSPPPPPALPLMDSTGATNMLNYIKTIDRQRDNSNNSQVGGGMQEAWAFFAGKTGLSGTTYTSPITNPCQRNFVIYIANAVNNGKPQDTGQNPINALVAAGATSAQQQQITIPIPPGTKQANQYQSNWGDEWARFMYQTDVNSSQVNNQNVITYTIAVTDGNNPDYVNFVGSMANNGGGKSYVVKLGDVTALTDALLEIFNEMQAVNNVFASVSLPVSVNSQGTYLNQVYIGMFRPDASAAPRWVGNLKQYKLGYDSKGEIVLLDSSPAGPNQQSAISNAGTGFISPNAKSYWSAEPPLAFGTAGYGTGAVPGWPATGFWINSQSGASGALDLADGEIVEKGGAGEMLRAQYLTDQTTRRLLTCASGACASNTALVSFDTKNTWLTGTAGVAALKSTAADVNNLINWVRGTDVYATIAASSSSGSGSSGKGSSGSGSTSTSTSPVGKEAEQGPGGTVTVRPSIHGDVLHSRPVVVNYGGSTNVVVFYGANDGVFHAINGNQTSGIGGVRPGGELWGFVPPEFYGKLSRIYTNTPEIQLSGTPAGIGATPRDYFFDGTTTVYQDLRDPLHPRVVLYITARRGGRLIYAIDVTDPVNPQFLWSTTNTQIAELGQTWSQPRVIRVKGNTNPVLIMGAGYDPAEDSDPAPGTNSQGRGMIVLDALTGSVVWARLADCTGLTSAVCASPAGLARAIPSDVAVVDRNGDGYIDKAYVGDVGGNVWRADFETSGGTAPANWTLVKLASLGGAAGTNNARKFLYPPDVVSTANFDAIMMGTGDREHPLYTTSTTAGLGYNVVNRFYMVKDTTLTGGLPSTWVALTESSLTDATSTKYVDSTSQKGFYLTLGAGEKVVNAPLTVAGYTYFGTNSPSVPKPGACYPDLGVARGYSISFLTGLGQNANRYVTFDGGGLPPSPVFGIVSVKDGSTGITSNVGVLIGGGSQTGPGGGNNTSPLGGQKIVPAGVGKRKRLYWYSQIDK
ncbi:pilus assembly protein [Cupriavidus sp. IDO]|uniref:pilus assembly protein n=1 Tax=Cupriavidus sp. IDO TaxID=1539142 RepID=UPI000579054F|nr:PilC/PilY family type IV pilus protein [Cupriavidus sp. IDO]KWR89996.1 pilus assembly protein PilY [Cupriavidus sp. IDO]